MEEEQTTQWPEEKKGQKDKQRSTKHYTWNKWSSNTNPTKQVQYILRYDLRNRLPFASTMFHTPIFGVGTKDAHLCSFLCYSFMFCSSSFYVLSCDECRQCLWFVNSQLHPSDFSSVYLMLSLVGQFSIASSVFATFM